MTINKNLKVGIIGYGKMGSSLIKGMLKSGSLSRESVLVYDIDKNRSALAHKEGLKTTDKLLDLGFCNTIILAVKPKDMPPLLEALRELNHKQKPLFVSIAAGVSVSYLESKLGEGSKIIRVMPNIAASVNESASVLVHNKNVTEDDLTFIRFLFESVGLIFVMEDESILDVATGISGSGPAYFFFLMKLMEEVGRKYGLRPDVVRRLVAQTCKGAGNLALSSKDSFDQLIRAVASPGGTTEEALKVMNSRGFAEIVLDAISAAIERSKKWITPE